MIEFNHFGRRNIRALKVTKSATKSDTIEAHWEMTAQFHPQLVEIEAKSMQLHKKWVPDG